MEKLGTDTERQLTVPAPSIHDSATLNTSSSDYNYLAVTRCKVYTSHWVLPPTSIKSGRWILCTGNLPAERVMRALDQIIEGRGKQACPRCDNGPEYIGKTMLEWAIKRRFSIIHTQRGNPQQNAYVERYNRTVRYDWLAQNLFGSSEDVQLGATAWLWTYNNERPNMTLVGITPR